MKAIEFAAVLNTDCTLTVPHAVANQVQPGQSVRVLMLLAEDERDDWAAAAVREFGMGYADSDAIYDQLSTR